MGGRAFLIAVVLAATPAAAQTAPECAGIDLVVGASRPGVRAVVARERVADSPFPWGRSIAVVTHVWGTGQVERWITSDAMVDCLLPSPGPVYEAIGGEVALLVPASGTLSGLERAALDARFGDPIEFAPSWVDRSLAWLRVTPEVPLAVVVMIWGAVALIRRRRRHPDPYLF